MYDALMPDSPGGPSEFGGKVRRNRTQPPPHVPTAREKLMLLYTTGDVDGTKDPDNGEAFAGLLSAERQTSIRQAEGVLDKGQKWDEVQSEAERILAELAAEVSDV